MVKEGSNVTGLDEVVLIKLESYGDFESKVKRLTFCTPKFFKRKQGEVQSNAPAICRWEGEGVLDILTE